MWSQRCYFAGHEERLTLVQKVSFYYYELDTGSPQFVVIHKTMVLKPESLKYQKTIKM
jgi:hypothetical protein